MNPSSKHFPGFDPAKQHRQGRKPPAWYSTAWPRLVSRVLCRTHSETRIKNRCDPENKTWFCSYDSYSGSHGKSQVLLAVWLQKGTGTSRWNRRPLCFLCFLTPFYSFLFLSIPLFHFLISHLRWRKCWSRRATALATVDQYFTTRHAISDCTTRITTSVTCRPSVKQRETQVTWCTMLRQKPWQYLCVYTYKVRT